VIRPSARQLASEIAEIASGASSLLSFREETLTSLRRAIGCDLATVQDARTGTTGIGFAVDDLELTKQHARWEEEQPLSERPSMATASSLCLTGHQLKPFECLCERLSLPSPSSMATHSWTARSGPIVIGLTRMGASRAFDQADLALLDCVIPVFSVAQALLCVPAERVEPFGQWCDEAGLTHRQREVAHLVTRGLRNAEIATILRCSSDTVRNHLVAIFRKAGVTNKAELTFQSLSART